MGQTPENNNTALGPDAPLPAAFEEKITYGDHKENFVDEDGSIKELGNVQNPLDALGIPDWRAVEKKVVKRLDMTLLPMLWILYLSNYLDRTNIAQARLDGFDEYIGYGRNGYNTAVALLTVGYVLHSLMPEHYAYPLIVT